MYYVYIVECSDRSYYTGISWSVEKRLEEHNSGLTKSTKAKLPVKLLYSEEHSDQFAAAKREREIKGWSRRKKENLINSVR